MELADINGNMVDIYLYGGNQLPVPRYNILKIVGMSVCL